MEKLKVGVIGAGVMGSNHIRVYSEMPHDVDLIGIFEPDTEKANFFTDRYGIIAFESAEELLGNVQAVSITAPTSLHFKLGMLCAEKSVHALIEKPIAANYTEGKQINDAFIKNDLVIQVGHIERFNPAIVELKSIIQGFNVLSISFERLSVDRRIKDASVVHDLMIHDIDILNWLVGDKIKHIYATGIVNAIGNDSVDFAQALVKFQSGVTASLTASRITEDKVRTISIHTDESFITVDCVSRSICINRKTNAQLNTSKSALYRQETIVEKLIVPQYEPLRAQLNSFVESVRKRTPPLVSGATALTALEIADIIQNKILENE